MQTGRAGGREGSEWGSGVPCPQCHREMARDPSQPAPTARSSTGVALQQQHQQQHASRRYSLERRGKVL